MNEADNRIIVDSNDYYFDFPAKNADKIVDSKGGFFVGRQDIKGKLNVELKATQNGRGCYLVGGYRGVGKTTTVQKAIKEYEEENEQNNNQYHILQVDLQLGDDTRKNKRDLFSEIIDRLEQELNTNLYSDKFFLALIAKIFLDVIKYIIISLFIIVLLIIIDNFYNFPSVNLTFAQEYILKIQDIYKKIKELILFLIKLNISYLIILGFSFVLFIFGLKFYRKRYMPIRNAKYILDEIDKLKKDINSKTVDVKTAKLSGKLPNTETNVEASQKRKYTTINNSLIQNKLNKILTTLKEKRFYFKKEKTSCEFFFLQVSNYKSRHVDIIFIFDELDKLANEKHAFQYTYTDKKSNEQSTKDSYPQEVLLSELKGFLSSAPARFIFISDRELLDRYYSESTTKNSLYDGIFDAVFYIKSLITDHSYGKKPALHRVIEKYLIEILHDKPVNDFKSKSDTEPKWIEDYVEDIHKGEDNNKFNKIYILHRFVEYLTIYSWGIPRRLNSLIKIYLKQYDTEERGFFLGFKDKDIKRIVFSSKFYQSIDFSMANHLSRSDDKLVISTIVGVHEVLRFHSLPFSRQYFDRSEEGINVHWDPNLHSTLKNLIENVFNSSLRKIKNGIFEFRFQTGIQEEVQEITRLHGAEASSFIFGPSTTVNVINYYLLQLENINQFQNESSQALQSKAIIYNIIGDVYFWERSFDQAYVYYSQCATLLKIILRTPDGVNTRLEGLPSFSSQFLLGRVLLKNGLTEELRHNFNLAIRLYRSAAEIAKEYLDVSESDIAESHSSKIIMPIPKKIDTEKISKTPIEKSLAAYWVNSGKKLDYRELLITAMLAIDGVSLKMGRKGRNDVTDSLPSLTNYYFLDNDFNRPRPIIERKDYGSEMLQKALLVRLVSNDSKPVIDEIKPLIIYAWYRKKKNDFLLNYAECMLISIWCQAYIIDKFSAIFNDASTHEQIKKIIFEICEIDIEKWRDSQINRESYIEQFNNEKGISIAVAIQFLFIASQRLMDLGFRVRAVHLFMLILSIWIFLIETAITLNLKPSQISKNKKDFSNLMENIGFIEEIKSRMYKCSITVDSGDFYSRRKEWLKNCGFDQNGKNKRYTSKLLSCLVNGQTGDLINEIKLYNLFAFWHRSIIEMHVLTIDLWEQFASSKLASKAGWCDLSNLKKEERVYKEIDDAVKNEEIKKATDNSKHGPRKTKFFFWDNASEFTEKVRKIFDRAEKNKGKIEKEIEEEKIKDIVSLNNSPRNRALFFWVKARGITEKVRKEIDSAVNNEGQNKKEIKEEIKGDLEKAFRSLTIAFANVETSLINGFPISFPVKAMIYYGYWDILYIELIAITEKILSSNDALSNPNFRKKLSITYRVPRPLYDLDAVSNLVISEFTEISHFRNRDSRSYQDMLKSRYFLFDDFDDPIFNIDWVNQHLLASSAPKYIENVENKMKEIRKKNTN